MRLTHVIAVKMAVTLLAWACPLLACPPPLFEAVGLPVPSPPVFARLLGAAYLALLVVYAGGWREARAGRYPRAAVLAGVVSNGLACLLLVVYGLFGAYSGWGDLAQGCMWGSAVMTGAITAGLLVGKVSPGKGG